MTQRRKIFSFRTDPIALHWLYPLQVQTQRASHSVDAVGSRRIQSERNRNRLGIDQESIRNRLGVDQESIRNRLGVDQESIRNQVGIGQESEAATKCQRRWSASLCTSSHRSQSACSGSSGSSDRQRCRPPDRVGRCLRWPWRRQSSSPSFPRG